MAYNKRSAEVFGIRDMIKNIVASLLLSLRAKIVYDNNGGQRFRLISNVAALVAINEMLILEKAGELPDFLYFEMAQSGNNHLISVCRHNRKSRRTTVIKVPSHLLRSDVVNKISTLSESFYVMPNNDLTPPKNNRQPPNPAEVIDDAKKLLTEARLDDATKNVAAKPLILELNEQQRQREHQYHPERVMETRQPVYI